MSDSNHTDRSSAGLQETLDASTLLNLLWLASPALPAGGFSYSEGLESAIESGLLGSEHDIQAWLIDQLHLALGRSELKVMALAHAAWRIEDVAAARSLNDWVFLSRESSEFRQQSSQMGRSLQLWLQERHGGDVRCALLGAFAPGPSWPVAYALALVLAKVPVSSGVLAMAFAWAENGVQAALKSGALGQNAGQRMLAALVQDIPAVADAVMRGENALPMAYAPGLAVVSSRHEQQYSRLFRS